MDNRAIALLRSVKGVPLSILVAFMIEGGSMGHDYLVRVTGWSKDKVSDGLKVLQDLKLIEQLPETRYNGWVMTDRGNLLDVVSSPIIQDSICATTELSIKRVNDISSSSRALECEKIGLAQMTADKMEVVKILNNAGIMGITALRLANTPHVTKEYVKAHISKARKEHTKTGILITRMRDGDPAPVEQSDEYIPQTDGIYADYIIH